MRMESVSRMQKKKNNKIKRVNTKKETSKDGKSTA